MTFDADVTKIDGKEIKIYKVGETTAVHIIIGNDATVIVSITGNTVTIDPIADLEPNTNYDVTIAAGTFKDTTGNEYSGITMGTPPNDSDWVSLSMANDKSVLDLLTGLDYLLLKILYDNRLHAGMSVKTS